ncbi:MAG: YerC/YecD family TrpR-related protein [Clostridia bacterium]|nr:YerC/YecD family TrpR-related protein [Clostridia bacterium]
MTDDFMHHCEDELYGILLKLQTKEDCKALLEDLCTYKEVENMAMRAHAAKLCMEGKTYTEITKETKLSSTTISRIAKCVSHGSGGYRAFITPDAPEAETGEEGGSEEE